LSREIKGGCGADLMSDVLAYIQPEAVLLTGLCNPQVVRTSQMADVAAIVLVRGKNPPQETIDLANAEGIPLITSPYGMFELCGRLYQAGLPSLENSVSDGPSELE
jgi:predicted transcriptional regulator